MLIVFWSSPGAWNGFGLWGRQVDEKPNQFHRRQALKAASELPHAQLSTAKLIDEYPQPKQAARSLG
jgi:hypothetical protein